MKWIIECQSLQSFVHLRLWLVFSKIWIQYFLNVWTFRFWLIVWIPLRSFEGARLCFLLGRPAWELLRNLWQSFEDVIYPILVGVGDMERLQVAAACEMIGSIIALCTQLSCHSRYTKGACNVVVCVSANLLGKHFVRIPKTIAWRERSFLAYAPEDSESARL